MKTQEEIIENLHQLWNNFMNDKDDQNKELWIYLFLYEFQSLQQDNLSIGTSTFLNSVAFQLTSYMLQLVYGIICDSFTEKLTNIDEVKEADHEPEDENHFCKILGSDYDFTQENYNLSKLILGTPNDITAIISLRKFLTNGLGGKILEFLQNCDIKFITSRKIFATLLINLFPNNPWQKPHQLLLPHSNDESFIETFINDFIFLQLLNYRKLNMTDKKNKPKDSQSKLHIPVNLDFIDEIKMIEYDEMELKKFKETYKTSDEIAFLLINLLIKLVKDEYTTSLDENSFTIDCFQFALETIVSIDENNSFYIENCNILKSNFLILIENCLNNFFIKSINYSFIDLPAIIKNLLTFLEKNYCKNLHSVKTINIMSYNEKVIIFEILFLIFGLLNNFLTISNYKINKMMEVLKWFKDKIDNIIEALKLLFHGEQSQREKELEDLFFAKLIDVLLNIIETVKITNCRKQGNTKRKFRKKLRRPSTTKQQQLIQLTTIKQFHCRKNQIPCIFEEILLKIFLNFTTMSKEIILKNFQRYGICCCHYNLELINQFININQEIQLQKYVYKFLASRVLKTIFMKNHCNLCETKSKSYSLHSDIFQTYKNKYLSLTNVPEILSYLKHLLKIANLLTFDITSRILVDIILPIFRNEKEKLQLIQCDNDLENTKISKSLTLNINLECLNLFINYLTDIRLIKGFFNDENLRHLEDLLYLPELCKAVCDLIQIGLNNASYLGDNQDEKTYLGQRLFKMQLNTIENCSAIFFEILKDLNSSKYKKNVAMLGDSSKFHKSSNPILILWEEEKLKIADILYITSMYWNLTLELYKSSQQYRQHFQSVFPNISLKCEENSGTEVKLDNSLFAVTYNILSAFLYCDFSSNENTENKVFKKNKCDTNDMSNLSSIFIYNCTRDVDEIIAINVCETEEIILDNDYILHASNSQRVNVLVDLNTSEENTSYVTITQDFNLTAFNEKNKFLNSLKSSVSDALIFDIKNQKIQNLNQSIEKNDHDKIQEQSIFSKLYETTFHILKTSFPFIFTTTNEGDGNTDDQPEDLGNDIIKDWLYLFQPGDGKIVLIKIFETLMNIFVLENINLNDKIMQQYLQKLKLLLLSNAEKCNNNVENANAIIQALQSLLKVAELANRPESISINKNKKNIFHNQLLKRQSSAIIEQTLGISENDEDINKDVFGGRMSFISDENDYYSSKASCSHQESEIEISENDTEEFYMTADEGYDADAEIHEISEADESNEDLWSSFTPSSRLRTHFVHEGIRKIIVEILICLSEKCITNPGYWANNLCQLANRLFIIKQSLGGSLFLLEGFTSILKCNDAQLKDIQQSILNLIMDINTPEILSAYLGIFASENPPVGILMKYLSHICTNVVRIQPKIEMIFPVECDGSLNETQCSSIQFKPIIKMRNYHEFHRIESPLTNAAIMLPIVHTDIWNHEGFTLSTWIEIKNNVNLSHGSWQHIEENWPNIHSELLQTHIISVGTNQLMLSIYVNSNLHLVFQTSKPNVEIDAKQMQNHDHEKNGDNFECDNRKCNNVRRKRKIYSVDSPQSNAGTSNKENSTYRHNKIGTTNSQQSKIANAFKNTKMALLSKLNLFNSTKDSDSSFERNSVELKQFRLPGKKWTHLCFAVDIKLDHIIIKTIINGSEQYTLSLSCNNLQNLRKTEDFEVICIGHAINNNCVSENDAHCENFCHQKFDDNLVEYAISNLLVFDRAFMNKNIIANLTALGPDAYNFRQCQMGNLIPNYGFLNLDKSNTFDVENFNDSIKTLNTYLVIAYSFYEPNTFIGFERRLEAVNPNVNVFDVIYLGLENVSHNVKSLQTAVMLSGGLSSLLFLFARIVELSQDSNIQALTLNLLLKVALSDVNLYTEFMKKDYLNLISCVIRSVQCTKDVNLLKCIVNNACNQDVLVRRSDIIYVNENTNAIIIYPHLLINVLRKYCDWYRSGAKESKVLESLLKCIQSLVREKHPHQLFNMKQLSNGGLIKELLNLCKIYIVEAPLPIYMSVQCAELFASVLSIFAGSPPSLSLIDEIMKLLLLLQKPSECFITHDRSKFYFIISPDPPIKHKRISLPLPSKQLRNLMKDRKKSLFASTSYGNKANKKSVDSNSTSSKVRFLYKDKMKISSSRSIVERETVNFSNVLKNLNNLELETLLNCNRLDKTAMNKLKLTKTKISIVNCNMRKRNVRSRYRSYSGNTENRNRFYKLKKTRSKSTTDHLNRDSQKELSNTRNNDNENVFGDDIQSADIKVLTAKGYDIVQSDEVLSSDSVERKPTSPTLLSKKARKLYKKIEFYSLPGIMKLQERLFNLLKDFILILPDSSVDEVLTHYVKLEMLFVLANNKSEFVRASIVRLLCILCDRLPASELQAASKKFYWHHCANQIAMNCVDRNLCEACIQWITGTYNNLDEILLSDQIQLRNKYGLQTFLAILIQVVDNTDVGNSAFQFALNLYVKDPSSNSLLIENGIVQVAVKSLYKICMRLSAVDVKIKKSIIELLYVIAEKSIRSSGQMNILWDIFSLLSFYEENEISGIVQGFRSVQATLLLRLLEIFVIDANPSTRRKNSILKMKNDSVLSLAEIKIRFELIVDRCSQFFMVSDSSMKPTTIEIKLFKHMVILSLSGNTRFNNFIAWGMLPSRSIELRIFFVDSLWNFCTCEGNPSFICDGKMLRSLLWLFLHEEKAQCDENQCDNLKFLCERLNISESDFWNVESELDKVEMNREHMIMKQKPIIEKVVYKYESIIPNCVESSMIITRIVADLQNAERKILMAMMKERDESYIFYEWMRIIQNMTHEGAPWFNSDYSLRSWEMDDTEGPARIRNRLRRCELDLNPRFIMEEYYQKVSPKPHPLDFLKFAGDQQINFTSNSQILYNFPTIYLPVDKEIDGELLITDTKLIFVATYCCKLFYRSLDIKKITEIWTKRYQHQDCAFEIFLDTNLSLLFAFQNQDDWLTMKEIFHDKIIQCTDPNKLLITTQNWQEGLLTNWEYLMALNQISGRTYNDLMQYPIFPWILSNYTSNILDLTDKNNFRKLEKPIAIQNKINELHYIKNYGDLESSQTTIGSRLLKPYHYSSHYSNSGTVLQFLVRVPPFTNFFLRYQDNKFDMPDRTFHSISTTWSLASHDSPTDVRELIPEFYCLPEIFENFEKFKFGHRQSGEIVNNVQLPPWCSDNPRIFVLIHRQALESEIVRNSLHNWIDLIFGYKQTGQHALDSINVFHPATYPDFLTADIKDPVERRALETMVKTYGQMPRQLLKSPHPISKPMNYNLGQFDALPTVRGLRWGAFTGSPQLCDPALHSIEKFSGCKSLISFKHTNVVYVLPEKCCVMQGSDSDVHNLISWHHNDKLIRIQSLGDFVTESKPLIYNDTFDEITTCGSDQNSSTLWFGHKSGKISVYQCSSNTTSNKTRPLGGMKLSYNSAFRKISSKSNSSKFSDDYEHSNNMNSSLLSVDQMKWNGPIYLIMHTDEITGICLSTEFKIVVSTSKDGLAVLWDLNNFIYIRKIERPSEIRHSPISSVAISPTLGDIVTVHSIEKCANSLRENECFEATEDCLDDFVNVSINPNGKSIMRLHSVNAKYINHIIHESKILSICYSYVKEGAGINVIATGIECGIIRLWSSWNLSFVREIIVRPEVISLTYSTYQHLIALTKDGYIQVWESEGLYGNVPKFPQILFNQ